MREAPCSLTSGLTATRIVNQGTPARAQPFASRCGMGQRASPRRSRGACKFKLRPRAHRLRREGGPGRPHVVVDKSGRRVRHGAPGEPQHGRQSGHRLCSQQPASGLQSELREDGRPSGLDPGHRRLGQRRLDPRGAGRRGVDHQRPHLELRDGVDVVARHHGRRLGDAANPFCNVSGAAMLVVSDAEVANGGCAAI